MSKVGQLFKGLPRRCPMTPTFDQILLPDGYSSTVRWWRPSRSRGVVLYLHGIQSHGGWYETSGAALAEAGLTVLMPDRRGSGLNPTQRGHAESAEQCLDDTRAFLSALLRQTRATAAHVVGVSWGGKLAAALAARGESRIASLSLVAPGLFPRIDLSTADKFRVGLSLMNDPERRFAIPLNDPRLFTNNPARIRFVEEDPYKLNEVTARFLLASRRLDRGAARLPDATWGGPVHLMLAGHDPIIDNERTHRWFRRLRRSHHQLTVYPDAYHTIEFESDPSRFLRDLVSWISARCDSVAG